MTLDERIDRLRGLTVAQLQAEYAEVFGEETPAHNKAWLVKRIAWRLQARAEGGLSERALRRATELADDADLRMNPPVHKGSHMSWRNAPRADSLGACDVAPRR